MVRALPDCLHVEIVTPSARILECDAGGITVPGTCGEYGVLPGHIPMMTELDAGIVTLVPPHQDLGASKNPTRYFVSGGFADVRAGSCVILTEDAEPLERLESVAVLQERLESLQKEAEGSDEVATLALNAKSTALEVRLRVARMLEGATGSGNR